MIVLDPAALTALREMAGLSRAGLARRSGLSQGHISELERGEKQARPATIRTLARGLGVPLSDLLQGVDTGSPGGGFNPAALTALREMAGLSQAGLARRSGLSQGHISELERAAKTPRWRTVHRLAVVLGVPASALAGRDVLVTWIEELQPADLEQDPDLWADAELLYKQLGSLLSTHT